MTPQRLPFDFKSKLLPITIGLSALFVLVVAQNPQQNQTTPIIAPTLPNCTTNSTKPTPPVGSFDFKNKNLTTTCLNAKFSTYIVLQSGQYVNLMAGNTSNTNRSDCGAEDGKKPAQLVVEFDCGSISFTIGSNSTHPTYISSLDGKFNMNGKEQSFSNNTIADLFHTTLSGHYFKCNAEQPIQIQLNGLVAPNNTATLMLSNFALEAFRNVNGNNFYQIPEECAADSGPVSDLVRVGVGISLIALVAIVLIAYFIGRRRWSERSSYESV